MRKVAFWLVVVAYVTILAILAAQDFSSHDLILALLADVVSQTARRAPALAAQILAAAMALTRIIARLVRRR